MDSNPTLKNDASATVINCNDATLQAEVLTRHRITPVKFNSMTAGFFGAVVPAPKHFNGQDILDIITGLDCNDFKIKLDADENDTQSNNEIGFSVEQQERIEVNYSIVLFKALFNEYELASIHFTKAATTNAAGTKKNDIIFIARTADNSPVYYGDLSDLLP